MSWGMSAAHVSDEGWTVGASVALASDKRARAVMTVCRSARDASDAAMLLEALGLDPAEARKEKAA